MINKILKSDLKFSKMTKNIFKIECNNYNDSDTKQISLKEKVFLVFNIFGNPYFPWNFYIRKKYEFYYNNRILTDKELGKNFFNFYLKEIEISKDSLILDYGCGEGRITGLLQQLGFKNIVAQDIAFFKRWEKYNANFIITPINCNCFYPYKDEVFDIVFSIQVRMYLNDKQLIEHIKNIARILKKGGYFIFEDRNEFMINPKNYIKNKCCPYIHKRERLIKLLEYNGFEIISEKTFGIDTKFFSKYVKWLRNFLVPIKKYDVFDFYEKFWLDKYLKRFVPKGKEPLHLFILRKK